MRQIDSAETFGNPEANWGTRSRLPALRILFVARNHLPHVGGAEISTHHLALALRASGHEVQLSVAQRRRSPSGLMDDLAGRITRVTRRHFDDSLGYPTIRSIAPLEIVEAVAREVRPDIVVVTGTDPAFAIAALRRLERWPTALYVRGASCVPYVLAGAHYDIVIANSPFICRSVQNLGVDALFLPSVFPSDAYRVDTTREKVLFVNPIPKKGVDIALRLAADRPDIPFVFNLSWRMKRSDFHALQRLTRTIPNIELRTATNDPAELYRDARLVLVPTQWPEAWPRVISEAQLSGIPAVAGLVGGVPESMGEGGILVTPPSSRSAWEAGLSQLWDDDARYGSSSEAALEHIKRPEMSPAAIVSGFEAMARRAIESHKSCQ